MDQQASQHAAARQQLIDALGRVMALYGLPMALGRTHALLILADEPMNVQGIAAALGMTKGTVSVNIRTLERLRLVRQVWAPGRRGKFYVAERDYRQVVADLMQTTVAAEREAVGQALDQADQALEQVMAGPDEALRARAEADRARIAGLREQYASIYQALEGAFAAWLKGEPRS